MRVYEVTINGHGWRIEASSKRIAIARGVAAYYSRFPKARKGKTEHMVIYLFEQEVTP